MTYTITKSDGTVVATVPENAIINDVLPVALVGRGSTSYGAPHSTNFVHLLENFANSTPPENPIVGMLWYDTAVGIMKVRSQTSWVNLSGVVGNGGGTVLVQIGATSVLVFAAGNKVIACLAPEDIAQSNIPVNVAILNQVLPFRSRFPNGLEGGYNLATDPNEYILNGRVRQADASLWAGGGTPFAATTFLDLGAASIAISISNNEIIAVYSQTAIANGSLPVNFKVNGITIPLRAAFPNGLVSGLTMAGSFGIGIGGGTITGENNGITLETVEELISEEATARASAIMSLQTSVGATYATASALTALESAFISGTGQSSVATAVDYLITAAAEGTANAEATTQLRSELTSAITGATTFADALSRINTSVSGSYATTSSFNDLTSQLRTGLGATSTAQISSRLTTLTNQSSANASSLSSIVSTFLSATGETNTASAINRIWSEATASGASSTWELDVEANGSIAGLQLTANNATKSAVNIRADQFSFWHPSTPTVTPFYIKDNKVYIRNLVIENGSIGADKLTTLFITEEVYRGTPLGLPSTNAAISGMVVSTGAVEKGSKVIITFSCNVYGSDSGGMWATIQRSDGKWLTGRAEFGCPDEGGSSQSWTWTDTIPANGTYSYQIWGDEFGKCTLKNAHMVGLVQKQYNAAAPDNATTTAPEAILVVDGESDYESSGSPTAGTGGIGYGGDAGGCVTLDMFLHNGNKAKHAKIGDQLTVLNYNNMDSTANENIVDMRIIKDQPCIRINSESGAWVECSISTPLTLYDGSVVYGRECLGKKLAVIDSDGFRWETISKVSNIGQKDVMLISANNQTYASGGSVDKMIFTHNSTVIKY